MFPNSPNLSTLNEQQEFIIPKKRFRIRDYEYGGIALSDASQGMFVQLWTIQYSGTNVQVHSPSSIEPTVLFTATGVTDLGLAFDQSMFPTVAYVQDGECKLRWYDTSVAEVVTTIYGNTYKDPQVTLDDARSDSATSNDIVFSYIREGHINFRLQRDRYLIEYATGIVASRLIQTGMTRNMRFQFKYIGGV